MPKGVRTIKVETINPSVEAPSMVAVAPVRSELEDLRETAVSLGMPKEDATKFDSVEMLALTINTLKMVKADHAVPLDTTNPQEEHQVEMQWKSKAERQKAYFDSLPKVRILIPCEGSEKPGVVEEKMIKGRKEMVALFGAVWSKTFNGYKVVLPKGVYVEVSQAIADNVAEEFNQINRAIQRFGVDRIDPKTGQPVADRL